MFSYFSQKTGFDISCKLSCMKYQSLFSEKNNTQKKIKCCLLNFTQILSVKQYLKCYRKSHWVYQPIFALIRGLPESDPSGIQQYTVCSYIDPLKEHGYKCYHEENEVSMIETTNTVVRPDTVVIKPVYTSVTSTYKSI